MTTNIYRPRALLALFAAVVLVAGLLALVGAKPVWAAEINFEPATNYPIDPNLNFNLRELTATDLDGDGNAADLAVAGSNSTLDTLGNVAVLSNNGDGTFAAARNVTAGLSPLSVTSADFDRDGKEDLAVANGSSNVSISLSNDDDTFQAAKYFPVGSGALQVTTGHFNDDGAVDFVDLAVVSSGSDAVSVLLGNGDGTFRAARNFEVGDAPESVTSGDFNGDGKADLATAEDPRNPASGNIADGVSVLLGNGDGTFKDAWRFSFPVGPNNHTNPQQVVSADFDGDGKADLAVANHGGGDIGGDGCCNAGYVRVLLSDGDGTFSTGQNLGNATGMKRPDSLTTADFDQDGIADLAIAQESISGSGVVAVSLGKGDGTFNEAKPFTADWYPTFVIAEDFNDDNYPDLAVANRAANPRNVSVLLNIPPPGATTSTSGQLGTAGDPQPSSQLASSETGPSLVGSSAAAAGNTTRISVDPSGAQLNTSSSGGASISSNGRYVVFISTSPDLVANDTNNRYDVLVRDLTTGTTQRVSVDSSGNQGNDTSLAPFISSDGRYVAFNSLAFNLVANDTNGLDDVFVRDRDTDADGVLDETGAASTERANVAGCASQANRGGFSPFISANGRYVTFTSQSTNLVANDTNVSLDFFVRDRTMGTTQRVNVSSSGIQAHLGGGGSSISSDGRFAAFSSNALDLVANDTNGFTDVFVRELGDAPPQTGDCIAPTTTASARTDSGAAYTSGTWTNEDVQVNLSAQDNEGGSGVKEITYSINGGANQTYNSANKIPVTTEGVSTISFFATDNEGNRESPAKTFTVSIDRSPPTTSANATDSAGNSYASGTWTSKNVTVSLNASDGSDSGIKNITYSINGGANQTYNPANRIPVSTEGTATISYFATDNVGNQETPANTFTVKIDKSAPTLDTDNSDGSDGITPNNRETGISRDIEPIATFSDEMDAASLDTSAKLYQWNAKRKKWQAVPVAVGVVGKTATLNPYPADPGRLLAANKKYKVTVTTGAKNLAGLPMSTSKSWTFTTRG